MRNRVESIFKNLTQKVYRRKYLTLFTVLIVTFALSSQMTDLKFDTRDESFFHENDPILTAYNKFRDTFGQDDVFIIAMKPSEGLTLSFFKMLIALHNELEKTVPYLDEIKSLVNGRVIRAEKNTLHVEDLIPDDIEDDDGVDRVLSLIERYPMYENLLISKDRNIASIIIMAKAVITLDEDAIVEGFDDEDHFSQSPGSKYLSNEQNVEMTKAIRTVISDYNGRGVEFHLSGTPAFVADIQKAIEKDIGIAFPLSILIIIVFLFFLFRKISGVAYPLVIVLFSLFSCMGIMAMSNIPITNVIQILPTFLMVVGIGDSVHILTIFYRNYKRSQDKQIAIVDAVGLSGLPVLMTSVTTSCGLLSFAWAEVASVAQLGLVAPVGVMLAFFYTIFLLPALIAIFPMRKPKVTSRAHLVYSDRIFGAIAKITCRYPYRIALLSSVIIVIAIYFSFSVRLSHNAMTWFPDDAPIRVASELVNDANGGSVMLEVTVDSGKPNGIYDPELISSLDDAVTTIESLQVNGIKAGKAWSIADILKEINRSLHADKDEAYTVPGTREAIAQELILFDSTGSDDLEDFSDSTYQVARLSILAPFTDSVLYKDYVDTVKKYLDMSFPNFEVQLTGHISLFVAITKHFITSMIKSYTVALSIITVLILLMVGRVKIGLMSMIANLVPILCVFGLMGILDIPLDMATILIGSIVLGVVVDDTIHFLHHFRRAFDTSTSVEEAVFETLSTTGRALVITSVVLSGGFLIYTTSYLASNVRFGLLAGAAILIALIADLLMFPALLQIAYRKRERIKQ